MLIIMAPTIAAPPAKKLVVIDLGHGGKDPGAVFGKHKESQIVRAISAPLIEQLNLGGRADAKSSFSLLNKPEDSYWQDKNARVELSSYNERACREGRQQIGLLISIHINSAASQAASGFLILHNSFREMAEEFYKSMLVFMSGKGHNIAGNRGQVVFERKDLPILKVLSYKQDFQKKPYSTGFVPSLLLEMGFITNATDRKLMVEQPVLLANSIAGSINFILDAGYA